ncbi:retrovirus-related pol polyprotein from transposon TNT 1-94 [Tanacetum coccineum]|uniref:Retrovirus-related pol polyprotein from transposon TNT 1-94 n=1 Tax=Tanacetum coccineum TaxID=301880 RepID=A0ABQ4X8M4_9ASTR
MDEIKTINIELEHSVAKLLSENELLHKEIKHLKKIYKDQFDSIKKARALFKEYSDSLIAQLNSKYMENADLKGQIQEKVFVTTTLQNELWRLKGKNVLDNAFTITNATTIALGMFKLDIEPISHRLKNNRHAHEDYLKKTIENTNTIRGLVERARKQNPGKPLLESACVFTKHIQELLVYVYTTCPSLTKSSEKLVAVTPKNKDKKARFVDPVTSLNNTQKQCVLDFVQDVNVHSKSKSTKSNKKQNIWKPTGKMFTEIGYRWKPTGRTFTLVGNLCPLTRITSTKVVHLKETTSKITNTKEPNQSWGSNASDVPSSFSLVDFRSKDEVLEFTLKAYYEDVGISHQTSVARTPQQNSVVERQNQTLVEASRTMLISSKALIFLWQKQLRQKLDLSYIHFFGALCYPTNDSEDLGKLQPKADIGIFVDYAPAKKAF